MVNPVNSYAGMQSKQTLKSISCSLPSVQPASAFDGFLVINLCIDFGLQAVRPHIDGKHDQMHGLTL